jgi:predicted TIM-barrel fold metal-dependent hydrolase
LSSAPGHRIREQLDHPVIDSDGHDIEYLPLVRDELRELAGQEELDGFARMVQGSALARGLSDDQCRTLGLSRVPWWGLPAENTRDRATAMLPRLFYERLDELGLDFAVVYPTYGLMAPMAEPDELRQALCRAFNRYHAQAFDGLGDRLCPVAIIPMNTPGEAIAELDYAVGELGMKATLLSGHVLRPLPGENVPRGARWLDSFGPESPHDYDPVWRRCQELGVAPTFHSTGMGWGSRNSLHNYVFNHLGNFAAAGEAICRSLVLHGVPQRFPALRFAFLEGGVAWACNLFSDLLGHWEKRSRERIGRYDPARIDHALMDELFRKYAGPPALAHLEALPDELHLLSEPDEDPATRDEFAASGLERPEDIRQVFAERFFFGCEADDPQNAAAYDRRRNPLGLGLHAVFSSDVGHWDVPDMREVLPEAFELIETELLDEADFRRFTFGSPVALWAGNDPDFFRGTVLEAAAREELAREETGA